ncbi:hypothetical protein [Novosphingobium sp. P6W]|uniref:hypothetical protein n=1 Tax=Novosphingobium sp. P6W TaxID=1609758 RepID=UPI0005C70E70|nr:hypothetical protein [Novosphingobium sp. P6W]AXB75726.1 hypothetical protein TQ38_003670 [Novosphingobium sp. P6W]
MNASRLMILTAAGTVLLLGGCNKSADDQPKAAAGGDLLPRSASDDMLPYDTVRSQASLSAPDAVLVDDAPRSARPAAAASAAAEDDVVTDPVTPVDPASVTRAQ